MPLATCIYPGVELHGEPDVDADGAAAGADDPSGDYGALWRGTDKVGII
jgi:hypothetical protein